MRTRILLIPVILGLLTAILAGCGGGGGEQTGALAGYVYMHENARGGRPQIAILPEKPKIGTLVPLADALVEVEKDGVFGGNDTTTADGYYYIDNLEPGGYIIYISHPRFTGVIDGEYQVTAGDVTYCDDWALGSFHFLFAGVDNYLYINDLTYAEDDAVLLHNRLYSSNYLAGQVDLLLGSSATKANIQARINTIKNRVGYLDKFVFFFSGHGSANATNEFICPYDCTSSTSTMISDSELQSWVSGFPSYRCIFIFDTCYSGGMFKAPGLKAASLNRMARNLAGAGYIVMTACNDDEFSYESAGIGHGYFSYHLARGLETMAADTNSSGVCMVTEAFNYARTQTQSSTSNLQNPQIYRGTDGTADAWLYQPIID